MSDAPRFHISAMVVRQLGEQLISDEVTALLELVKNAYDADATYARVEVNTDGVYTDHDLYFPVSPHGSFEVPDSATDEERRQTEGAVRPGYILVRDDGTGMDQTDIEEGWLTISLSKKREMKREGRVSLKRRRTPQGDKGLGRLSTQRLGGRLEMFTVKESYDSDAEAWAYSDVETHVAVNWDEFHDEVLLRDVPVHIDVSPRESSQRGTSLVVTGLRDPDVWLGDARDALVGRLTQMISPFQAERPFKLFLSVNGAPVDFEELTRSIRDVALSTHEFVFDGDALHIEGRIKLTVLESNTQKKREEYRQLVGSDLGRRFFAFLKDKGKAIPGLTFLDGPEWFVSYSLRLDLRSLGPETRDGQIVNPGPFMGEIDQFAYENVDIGDADTVFDRVANYRNYLRGQAGVRVYRDGFGVRPYGLDKNDWMGFQEGQTSGTSFYGLRPRNVIGYVAISSADNPSLIDKTDREGLTETPASSNFFELMAQVRRSINSVFTTLRRSYNEFRKEHQDELRSVISADSLLGDMQEAKAEGDALHTAAQDLAGDAVIKAIDNRMAVLASDGRASRVDPEVEALLGDARRELERVQDVVYRAARVRERTSRLDQAADYLETQIEVLREQLDDFSELAGLGITAEALSHELENLIDRLSSETKRLIDALRRRNIVVAEVTAYTEYVRSAVSTLRKQLSHLTPSLRYVRERKDVIQTEPFFQDARDFYLNRTRFVENKLGFVLDDPFDNFAVRMNRGKLTQIVDNLVLNSEYWLREAVKQGTVQDPAVTVRAHAPYVEVSDNGLGVDPAIAPLLFQPFVTTKPKGIGRGLGLFITQQLLDSEGCSISLLPDLNGHGRRHVFQLDLTGALNG